MTKTKPETEVVKLRIPCDIMRQVREDAEREDRPQQWIINYILRKYYATNRK